MYDDAPAKQQELRGLGHFAPITARELDSATFGRKIGDMVVTAVLLLICFAYAAPVANACVRPVGLDEWRASAADVEAAWARLDLEGFRTATDASAAVLPCLGEPITPADAARAHRIQGLRANLLDQEDRAARAFLAARRVDPAWRFPDWLPEQHPLRLLYGRMPLEGLVQTPLPRPRSGSLLIDGTPSRDRPKDIPAVVQWLNSDGSVGWSGYMHHDETIVGYPIRPSLAPVAWSLAGIGVASLVVSGASLAISAGARDEYDDLATPPDALDDLRETTNTGFWVSVGSGAGAAGAAVAAAIVFQL